MTSTTVKSMGFELTVAVPADAAEFDQLAKRVGACVDEAVSNVLYRSFLADFRDSFCEALSKESGIERETKVSGKTKAGEDITVYAETEVDYVKRVAAEKGVDVSSFASLALSVASGIAFDPSAPERKAGAPKKIAKTYLEVVAEIENQAGQPGLQKVAAKLGGILGRTITLDFSNEETTKKSRETLAIAIKEDQDNRKKEVAKSLLS